MEINQLHSKLIEIIAQLDKLSSFDKEFGHVNIRTNVNYGTTIDIEFDKDILELNIINK
jgi:hypothetical protein